MIMFKMKPVSEKTLNKEMTQTELVMNIFRNKDEALFDKISNEGNYSTRVLNGAFRMFMDLFFPVVLGLSLGWLVRVFVEAYIL